MSTVDVALTRDIAEGRSLRGKRVDVPGVAFQLCLLACLFTALAFIVILIATVMDDGLSTYVDRGFVLSDFPSEFQSALDETWTFLTNPEGLVGWITSLVLLVGLPALVVWTIVKRRWLILVGLVGSRSW